MPEHIDEQGKELSEPTKEKDEFDTPEWAKYFEHESPEEAKKIKQYA